MIRMTDAEVDGIIEKMADGLCRAVDCGLLSTAKAASLSGISVSDFVAVEREIRPMEGWLK